MWPIRLKILNSREFFLHRSQHFPDRDICWQDLFITTFHNNNPELCSEIQRQHHISNKEKNHHTVSNWIHQDLNKENTKKMSTENGIPLMNKPVDSMQVGANGNNLATAAMRRHPIEELQQRQGVSPNIIERINISYV
jgi:hypothetical protein